MFHAWLFYTNKTHITTHKETVFECIRWAQNNGENSFALVLLPEDDLSDSTQIKEFYPTRKNGKQCWKQVKVFDNQLLITRNA